MRGFIAANLAISAYNLLFMFGVLFCMMLRVTPPTKTWMLFVPWAVFGALLYVVVVISINS